MSMPSVISKASCEPLSIDLAEEEGGELGPIAEKLAILRAVDCPATQRCQRSGRSTARISADQPQFPDKGPFAGDRENIAALLVIDLDLALGDQDGKVAIVSLAEEDRTGFMVHRIDMAAEGVEIAVAHPDGGVFQQLLGKIRLSGPLRCVDRAHACIRPDWNLAGYY